MHARDRRLLELREILKEWEPLREARIEEFESAAPRHCDADLIEWPVFAIGNYNSGCSLRVTFDCAHVAAEMQTDAALL
jgi:hypothetical protein